MSEIDKSQLYGDYRESAKKQQELALKAAHKALDIADDDMNIQANKYGMSPAGVVAVAVIAAGIPALAMWLSQPRQQPPTPAATQPAAAVPDSEYEVRFFDRDGKPIVVPHISTRTTGKQ